MLVFSLHDSYALQSMWFILLLSIVEFINFMLLGKKACSKSLIPQFMFELIWFVCDFSFIYFNITIEMLRCCKIKPLKIKLTRYLSQTASGTSVTTVNASALPHKDGITLAAT